MKTTDPKRGRGRPALAATLQRASVLRLTAAEVVDLDALGLPGECRAVLVRRIVRAAIADKGSADR